MKNRNKFLTLFTALMLAFSLLLCVGAAGITGHMQRTVPKGTVLCS